MISIATLNTWGVINAKQRVMRMRAIAHAITQQPADIIGLQEVWLPDDQERIITAAKASGYTVHSFDAGATGSGLMTLSRYPITEAIFLRYRNNGRIEQIHYGDFIASKGIGLVRISTPLGTIDVYNTHLIAQYHEATADTLAPHRAAQMFEATRFINTHSTQNPAVLLGDLNTRSYQIGYQMLTDYAYLTDVYRALHPNDTGFTIDRNNPYDQNSVQQRIDYILMRGKLKAHSCDLHFQHIPGTDTPYSDHYGLIAHLDASSDAESEQAQPDTKAALLATHDLIQEHISQIVQRRQRHQRSTTISRWLILLAFNKKTRFIGLSATIISVLLAWIGGWMVRAEQRDLQAIAKEISLIIEATP
jgi:sphingomyelin phosphodiesterase 2